MKSKQLNKPIVKNEIWRNTPQNRARFLKFKQVARAHHMKPQQYLAQLMQKVVDKYNN